MKKFLLHTLLFFIPLILALIYLEYYVRISENTYTYKEKLLSKNIDSTEILIVGSSYAFNGINPEFLRHKAFNLANNSEDLYYSYNVIKQNISNLPELKIIIIGMNFATLLYNLDEGPEYWRSTFYKDFYNIPRKTKNNIINDYSYLYTFGLKKSLLLAFTKADNLINIKNNGWQKSNNSLDSIKVRMILNSENKNTSTQNIQDCAQNLDMNVLWINQIIELTKEHNVDVFFVITPVINNSKESISTNCLNNIYNILIRLSLKNDNVYFLDYHNNNTFNYGDFSDLKHLNYKGAKKLTLILDKEINRFIRKKN